MRKMKKAILLGLAILTVRLGASAQVQSGSVVAITSSKDEIVIAADSRRLIGDSYTDSACKIAALGNKLIFAAVGDTGFGPSGAIEWDAQTVARNEFARLETEHTAHDWTLDLAKAWGNAAKTKVQELLTKYGKDVFDQKSIMGAVFAGIDKNGEVSLVGSAVDYQATEQGGLLATSRFYPIAPGKILVLGENEIADELFNASTVSGAELRQEAAEDAKDSKNSKDSTVLMAIEVVKLTIEHHSGKINNGRLEHTVGGPIDAVVLSHSTGIRWIQRKNICPGN